MYIKINGEKYTLDDLAEKLGINGNIQELSLCVPLAVGTLEAYSYASSDPNHIPCINTKIDLYKDGTSVMVACTEQVQTYPPTTYLYGRTDTYLAYMRHDVRTDDEFDEDPKDPELVVSGDHDFDVRIFRENDFICDCGTIDVEVESQKSS